MNLEQIDTSTTAGKAEVMRLAAEVMRLAAEGRRVAYLGGWNGKWVACGSDPITWNWESMEYAIIAEPVGPKEVWFTVINDCVDAGPYNYECTAIDRAKNHGGQAVKYTRDDLAGEKG